MTQIFYWIGIAFSVITSALVLTWLGWNTVQYILKVVDGMDVVRDYIWNRKRFKEWYKDNK